MNETHPDQRIGKIEHCARECRHCDLPQTPFMRRKGSSDPWKCSQCGNPERDTDPGAPEPEPNLVAKLILERESETAAIATAPTEPPSPPPTNGTAAPIDPPRVEMWTIAEWQLAAFGHATAKGFHLRDGVEADHRNPERIASRLALIHAEVSEALECVARGEMETFAGDHGKPEGFPIELADVAIRLLDLAQSLGIDLEATMHLKHEYNRTRPLRHGGKCL